MKMKSIIEPVRIVTPTASRIGHGTKVRMADGAEVPMVKSVIIRIEPDEVITAEMEIVVSFDEIIAHPLLGLDTLRQSADAHGYDLVKRKDKDA